MSGSIVRSGIVLIFFLAFCLVYSCNRSDDEMAVIGDYQVPRDHAFVGDQYCQTCHAGEWDAWRGSHHDYAMAEPDDETVRGDFNDVTFTDGNETFRFYREGDSYMIDVPPAADEDGAFITYEVSYTFGWEPLQQYLIDIGKGKLQALHIAWDTERNQWFSLRPDEQIEPDDWMHWTGGSMNWNTMCADCHSTNLQKNYIAEADSFHTTYSSVNVSCEACHGPGGEHVAFMNSDDSDEATVERIRRDLNLTAGASQLTEINTCAPCHSIRQEITDDYIHGFEYMNHYDPLLPHPDNYFPDGQIREEVFVYASFLQSRMYHEGVTCSDCHNPHSLELKATINDNKLCMQCHEPKYDTPEHHYHEVNTEASQCVNCHMTGRYYMEVDYRRDHSFRVPRPDQSERFGTPNACNDCHTEQPAAWASQAIEIWYGEDRAPHFSETLLKADTESEGAYTEIKALITDTTQPEIIRATAVWYAGQFPVPQSADILQEAILSDSPLIRSSAAKALDNLPAEMKKPLLANVLEDSVRAVRVSASRGLAEFTSSDFMLDHRDYFNRAMEDYRSYLDVNQYFPQGQMNRGQFFEQQGETGKAMEAYRLSLARDPYFNPARMNLAYLHNRRGENEQAEQLLREVIQQEPEFGQAYYSLALLLAEQNRLPEAVTHFETAAEHLPDQDRVYYNLAIANQTLDRPTEAETAYLKAIDSAPENPDYRYGIVTLYLQQEQYEAALEHVERLDQLVPNNPQVLQLLQMIEQELN